MEIIRQVIEHVKNKRGEVGRWSILAGLEKPTIKGQCVTSAEIADTFAGEHWRSAVAKDNPKQKYPGHSLAVIPTRRGKGAVVVDFTADNKKGVILGQIINIRNEQETANKLEQLTGYPGWRKQKNLKTGNKTI